MQRLFIAALSLCLLAISTPSEARRGSCDGIHRCTCGSTQARHFGFPRIYNGHNLWQAWEWSKAFPRTTLAANTVLVWRHHVARVERPLDNGNAIVTDEKGTYERSTRGAIVIDPNGNRMMSSNTGAPAIDHKHRARHIAAGLAYQERNWAY